MAGHIREPRATPPIGLGAQEPHWTDDLLVCQHSGIGSQSNQFYRPDGARITERESEDSFFHYRTDDSRTYIYAVFDGYDGKKVASFADQRLPAELLLGQLENLSDDQAIKRVLGQAIMTVERSYFESIDHLLAKKTMLKMQLPENINDFQLRTQFPDEALKLHELDEKLGGGTSLVVALLHHRKLFVANVGDSRALFCTKEPDGHLKSIKLSVDHNLSNDDEVLRLEQLGLDTNSLQQQPMLTSSHATRTIGNYSVKGGYKDIPSLRFAQSEPVIADPDIIGGIDTSKIQGFLVMYTQGLWSALETAIHSQHVENDIAQMVAEEFSSQSTLSSVAQAVVDRIVRMHHDSFMNGNQFCQKREDITMIVRNFNFPLGRRPLIIPSATTPTQNNGVPYPLATPVYTPPSAGSDLPTPNASEDSGESTPVERKRRSSSSGGSDRNAPFFPGREEGNDPDDDTIEAYVDFTELNQALLQMDLQGLKIA